MKLLFGKPDKVFQSESVDKAYGVYSAFISFNRTDQMSMSDYIVWLYYNFCHLTKILSLLTDKTFTDKVAIIQTTTAVPLTNKYN